jgi:ribosome recycling factor
MHNKDIVLEENNIKSFQVPMEADMDKAIKHFERELLKIRTGRAHTSLIEDLQVTVYGQTMALKGVASLAAPEPRLLTIQPWDIGVIPNIEVAIKESELGLTPINDGKLVRVQFPQMTTSRRDELSKLLGKKLEECKVSIRNVRKDFNNVLRDAKAEKKISENFFNRLSDTLQTVTDKFCGIADQLSKKKEDELHIV